MKQRVFGALTVVLFLAGRALPGFAASPGLIGYWETGKNQSVTQIYSCGADLLCGELVGFPMDHASDAMPQTWDHQPQCHFVFIRYLHVQGDAWQGTIINPHTGRSYGAEVSQVAPDELKLRGFVLLPLLGATRLWSRYAGPPPPADCRMAPGSLD